MQSPRSQQLTGKAVVVTGAGRGLGRAYAQHAAMQGASVVVNDVDAEAAEQVVADIDTTGGKATTHTDSIGTWEGARTLVETCVQRFGRIDGLVNNAGIFAVGPPTEVEEDTARSMVEVNVLGAVYCGVHALTAMVAQGSGSIVNVTSGQQCGGKGMAVYAATKGAVASLTYAWADDTQGTGVRVNAISPNAHTRMASIYDAYYGGGGVTQNIGKDPMTNAPAVTYLLSDLSSPLTGQVVRMDGGQLTVMTHPARVVPVATAAEWTVEAVADAFRGPLAGYVQPLGLTSVENPTTT